jgi:hypothetical protein
MSLKELLDCKPGWDQRDTENFDLMAHGKLPLFLAARSLNNTLTGLTLFPAFTNSAETDPRRRKLIPAYSGSRIPHSFDLGGKVVGLEATALLTLGFLNLLDVAFDAVLMALKYPNAHVRVLWTREDELAHAPLGAAQSVQLQACVDPSGQITHWQHELWANGYSSRPGRARSSTLLAASQMAGGEPLPIAINPPLSAGGGADRNAVPGYALANLNVINHRLMVMPLRTSAMRGLGAFANVIQHMRMKIVMAVVALSGILGVSRIVGSNADAERRHTPTGWHMWVVSGLTLPHGVSTWLC